MARTPFHHACVCLTHKKVLIPSKTQKSFRFLTLEKRFSGGKFFCVQFILRVFFMEKLEIGKAHLLYEKEMTVLVFYGSNGKKIIFIIHKFHTFMIFYSKIWRGSFRRRILLSVTKIFLRLK